MSRVFYKQELEGVASYWRIHRKDGFALGFSSHDRPLYFGGIDHRAAPGMLPSAIRRTGDLASESAEVDGALSDDAIAEGDLAAGLFDGARVEMGIVDWESLEHAALYAGTLGQISEGQSGFTAELQSYKVMLERDLVPRTSPTCRAEFCGPGCNLSAVPYTHRVVVDAIDLDRNAVTVPGFTSDNFLDGRLRFLEGPQTGFEFGIIEVSDGKLSLDRPLDPSIAEGLKAVLREGCDHTLSTCHARFSNAINFRGEPFLPGNDLLARYAQPQ